MSSAPRKFLFNANDIGKTEFSQRFLEDRMHTVCFDSFLSENGDELINYRIAYRVFGQPNAKRDNIVMVFHGLTGDANCGGYYDRDGYIPGWWDTLVKEGAAFDKKSCCIICPNHPSSCYGSVGPSDFVVGCDHPLGPDFPPLTTRDIAKIHYRLLQWLHLDKLYCIIGGSFGGMVVSELAVNYPDLAESAVMIAAPVAHNAQALAFNHIQRKCIEIDPHFNHGRYYSGPRPNQGLSLARQIGMITYRNSSEFDERFGRDTHYSGNEREKYFQIQSYLEHQGRKLLNRFDANSYIKLTRVMDTHDLSGGSGDFSGMLSKIRSNLLLVAIDSDILYPPGEIREIAELCRQNNVACRYAVIRSLHGHDGFLIEFDQLNRILMDFWETLSKSMAS